MREQIRRMPFSSQSIFILSLIMLLVFLFAHLLPNGSLLLPIVLAFVLLFLIFLGYFWMRKSETGHMLLYPSTIFSGAYLLLYVIMTFDLLFLRAYAGNPYDLSLLANALSVAILGLVMFVLGYIVPLGKISSTFYPAFLFRWNHKKVIVTVMALVLLSIGILVYIIWDTGGIRSYISNLLYKRDIFFQRSYLLALIGQINIALYIIFAYWLDSKRGGRYLFITAIFTLIVLIFINSRISFFVYTLALLFIYISKGRRINWYLLILMIVGLSLVAVFYGSIIREFIPYGINAIASLGSRPSFGESLRVFWDKLAPDNFDSLSRLTLVLENVPSNVPFMKGKSFLGVLAFLIPRVLYPDKPNGIGVFFTQVFYPISFLNRGGKTPSLLVDFYWNFGLTGVAFGMFLFGIFLRSISEYAWAYKNHVGPTIISAIMVSQIFGWLKAGSDTPTQAVVGNLLIWLLVVIFFKVRIRRRKSPYQEDQEIL